jgi:hypothetical protein
MEAVNIIDRFVGADWLLEFVVLGIPDGVTLEEATFVFKDHKEVTDSGAIITSTITTTATASGQLTQTAPSAGFSTATLSIVVPWEETQNVQPGRRYYYRVPITDNNDFHEVAAEGLFIPR